MVGRERSVSLRALGAYFSGFILISTCLSSPPTKVLAQSGKNDSADIVTPPPSGGPLDFAVEHLVDASTDTWEQVGLSANNKLEYGERVRFRAINVPPGIGWLEWRRNGSQIGFEPVIVKYWTGPAAYQVTLATYDASWNPLPPVTKTVWVSGPLAMTGTLPVNPVSSTPVACVAQGRYAWSLMGSGCITVADMGDASRPVTLLPTEPLGTCSSIALVRNNFGRSLLCVANRQSGVLIYDATPIPSQFVLLSRITTNALGGPSADCVASVNGTLYAASNYQGPLTAWSLDNPSQPALLGTTVVQDGVYNIQGSPDGFLAIRASLSNTLTTLDARDPRAIGVASRRTVTLQAPAGPYVCADGGIAAGVSANATALVAVTLNGSGVNASLAGIMPIWSRYTCIAGNRAYIVVGTGTLSKYDVSDPYAPYLMESHSTETGLVGMPVVYESAVPGAAPLAVFVGSSTYGFQVWMTAN